MYNVGYELNTSHESRITKRVTRKYHLKKYTRNKSDRWTWRVLRNRRGRWSVVHTYRGSNTRGKKSADLVFSRRRWLRLSDIQLDKYLNKFHNKVDQELDKRAGKKKENNRQKEE